MSTWYKKITDYPESNPFSEAGKALRLVPPKRQAKPPKTTEVEKISIK
jgi:hypothetical protein